MTTKPRIELIDALRGIAISSILLIHHIEHFFFNLKPDYKYKTLIRLDKWVWDNVFDIVAGKAFALFSLLFGISFWIIHKNRSEKNETYFYRHFWRMFILLLLGFFHFIFYRGDILIIYAVIGIPLIIGKYLSNRALLIISIILLLNPLYLYNLICYNLDLDLFNYHLKPPKNIARTNEILSNGSFFQVMKMNFRDGIVVDLTWYWNAGRFFSIPGLFYLGVFFGKTNALLNNNLRIWYRVLIISIVVYYFIDMVEFVWEKQLSKDYRRLFKGMIKTYSRLTLMFTYLSTIVILWYHNKGKVWITKFKDFGRMGLTNYILMSIIGSFIYYGWGLGLFKYMGSFFSFLIGLLCLWLQMKFSSWWLKKYKQGPLEKFWRKLTWIKMK